MKSFRNPLLFTLVLGGIIGYIAACNNAKPTTDANAAPDKEAQEAAASNVAGESSSKQAQDEPADATTQVAHASSKENDNVPHPDPEFTGKIGKTFHDSQADPKLFLPRSAPKGAPNILLVLIDDAGFGATNTFGGPCNTPTLTKLAENGLRYNRFHTTAVCSPTRAALLTGHNHHSAATGIIMECCTGYPGYTGIIPQNTASVGQILQDNGYTTAWIGKNHNVVGTQASMVGPHSRWPNALGFDYFYGFLCGEMNQWYPTIYENQKPLW